VLDSYNLGTDTVRLFSRAPGLHLLRISEHMQSALGTGACGACPVVDFSSLTLDAQGRFSKLEDLEGAYSQGEELTWEVSPELSRLEVFLTLDEAATKKHLLVRYTLDPKTGRYSQETFPRPDEDESEGVTEDSTP
jgi:hypothetical protein